MFVYLPKDLANQQAKVDGERVVDGGVKNIVKEQGMKAKWAAKVGVEAPTKEKDRERDGEQLRQGHRDIVGEDQAPSKDHEIKADLFDSTFGEIGQVAWFSGLNDPRFTLLKEILVSAIETRQLLGAAARGEEDTLTTLIANSIDVNHSNKENETALHIGAGCGYLSVVTTLLGTGEAELDLRDDTGNTALHRVVLNPGINSKKIAEELLIAGASLSVKNLKGQTPKKLAEDRLDPVSIDGAPEETPEQVSKDCAKRLSDLHELFTKPPLVEGPRTKSNPPKFRLPQGNEITACDKTRAVATEVFDISDSENGMQSRERHMAVYPTILDLLSQSKTMDLIFGAVRPLNVTKPAFCRWYHIPANNVSFKTVIRKKHPFLIELNGR